MQRCLCTLKFCVTSSDEDLILSMSIGYSRLQACRDARWWSTQARNVDIAESGNRGCPPPDSGQNDADGKT